MRADELVSKLDLNTILSLLNNSDSEVSILEAAGSIKTFSTPNMDVGELYFSNGHFWSFFESEEQLIRLVGFMTAIGLQVIGEEGEIYREDGVSEPFSPNPPSTLKTEIKDTILGFLKRHYISVLIIMSILFLGLLIN